VKQSFQDKRQHRNARKTSQKIQVLASEKDAFGFWIEMLICGA
jgi:hypothetical protein